MSRQRDIRMCVRLLLLLLLVVCWISRLLLLLLVVVMRLLLRLAHESALCWLLHHRS